MQDQLKFIICDAFILFLPYPFNDSYKQGLVKILQFVVPWKSVVLVYVVTWTFHVLQDCEAYNKGAFKIQIDFPAEYPFKPPKLTFKTKIYHPNIDEKGQVCLPIISAENWKPATKTDQG